MFSCVMSNLSAVGARLVGIFGFAWSSGDCFGLRGLTSFYELVFKAQLFQFGQLFVDNGKGFFFSFLKHGLILGFEVSRFLELGLRFGFLFSHSLCHTYHLSSVGVKQKETANLTRGGVGVVLLCAFPVFAGKVFASGKRGVVVVAQAFPVQSFHPHEHGGCFSKRPEAEQFVISGVVVCGQLVDVPGVPGATQGFGFVMMPGEELLVLFPAVRLLDQKHLGVFAAELTCVSHWVLLSRGSHLQQLLFVFFLLLFRFAETASVPDVQVLLDAFGVIGRNGYTAAFAIDR